MLCIAPVGTECAVHAQDSSTSRTTASPRSSSTGPSRPSQSAFLPSVSGDPGRPWLRPFVTYPLFHWPRQLYDLHRRIVHPYNRRCLLCRYCEMPQEVKNSLPRVDWTNRKILGYEVNRVPGAPACCAACCLASAACSSWEVSTTRWLGEQGLTASTRLCARATSKATRCTRRRGAPGRRSSSCRASGGCPCSHPPWLSLGSQCGRDTGLAHYITTRLRCLVPLMMLLTVHQPHRHQPRWLD